jgi:hypothetical protein
MTLLFLMSAFITTAQNTILINNVQIFDGKNEKTIIVRLRQLQFQLIKVGKQS